MERWFRFYDSVVNDPKVQRLPGDKFKAWVNLLCLASSNDGVLPALADIAFVLRLSDEKVSSLLNELGEKGLLDQVEVENAPVSYAPHNWAGRQYKSDATDPTVAQRMKRYRERKRNDCRNDRNADRNDRNADRNADCNGVTPVIRPDTETEQKQIAATVTAAPISDPEVDYFRRFKEVCGGNSGGLAKKLLTAKNGNVALARAAIEQATTKQNPREFVGAIIRGRDSPEDLRARGEAW